MGLALSESFSKAATSVLEKLRATAFAKAVLLLEKDGGVTMSVGKASDLDLTPFSVLSAACVSAGQELASLVGEQKFRSMVHQGEKISVYLETVDEHSILGVIFDRTTTLGLVKLRTGKARPKLVQILTEARKHHTPTLTIGTAFAEEARNQLDELFGG
jgi:predicted regulator of Ras-like GTPase activity (Roadblock/LC7/MglB family)